MNFNWWQTIIFIILVFFGGYFTRQFTYTLPPLPASTVIKVPGQPDTLYLPAPTVKGGTGGITVKGVDSLDMKPTYTKELDDSLIHIKVVSKPSRENDSLDIFSDISYELKPRKIQIISSVDTVKTYIPTPVEVPDNSFVLFKPEVTFIGGIVVGIVTVILLKK